MSSNNTKKEGIIRTVYFHEDGLVYGVCLDFDIVVHGADLAQVQNNLMQLSVDYIQTVIKNNLDDSLLNRHAPKEYWDKYESLEKSKNSAQSKNKTSVMSTYLQRYPSLSIA